MKADLVLFLISKATRPPDLEKWNKLLETVLEADLALFYISKLTDDFYNKLELNCSKFSLRSL